MADDKAGQQDDAQQDEEQQQDGAEGKGDEGDGGEQRQQSSKTYTQDEVDRILGKVRKNARYLGRKEAEAELLRQGASPRQAAAAVDKPAEDLEPKRENFEDYEKYLDARAEWKGRKGQRDESAKEKREAEERAEQDRSKTAAKEFKKRADAVMKDLPDFAEVIENADEVMITKTMGREIEESPLGPRILYELAKNPDEAARIAELPTNVQIREIGKLEARLEAAAKKAAPKEEKGDDAEGSDEEAAGDDEAEGEKAEADGKAADADRNDDGTFKSAKKRPAPEPIEPGSARSATGSKNASDKDDVNTWMRKENERANREGRR